MLYKYKNNNNNNKFFGKTNENEKAKWNIWREEEKRFNSFWAIVSAHELAAGDIIRRKYTRLKHFLEHFWIIFGERKPQTRQKKNERRKIIEIYKIVVENRTFIFFFLLWQMKCEFFLDIGRVFEQNLLFWEEWWWCEFIAKCRLKKQGTNSDCDIFTIDL